MRESSKSPRSALSNPRASVDGSPLEIGQRDGGANPRSPGAEARVERFHRAHDPSPASGKRVAMCKHKVEGNSLRLCGRRKASQCRRACCEADPRQVLRGSSSSSSCWWGSWRTKSSIATSCRNWARKVAGSPKKTDRRKRIVMLSHLVEVSVRSLLLFMPAAVACLAVAQTRGRTAARLVAGRGLRDAGALRIRWEPAAPPGVSTGTSRCPRSRGARARRRPGDLRARAGAAECLWRPATKSTSRGRECCCSFTGRSQG